MRINCCHQQGVSLLESMISLFVFSIGVLGLAALQLTALTGGGDSQQRSLAIWKAQELADRMRANPARVADYIKAVGNHDLGTVGVDNTYPTVDCASAAWRRPTPSCAWNDNNGGVSCSPAQLVKWDVWEVLCDDNTGAATAGSDVQEGTTALSDLQLLLRRNTLAADGNDDVELYFQWLARESDANQRVNPVAESQRLASDLCGREDIRIDARLDVYCLRFRP